MKINIIVDNDKCWHLNTIRRLVPFLKERKIFVNKIWVLPEKLSNFKGLSILYWYLNIFGLMNFIKLSAFYILVLIQNIFKKTNSFKDLAKMNDIKCVYLKNINDLTLYDDLKKENKNYNLIFTNHIISQKLLDLKNNVFINKMKFETKNVLEHLNSVANQSKKINRNEIERRLTELSRYSKKLALIQRRIDIEIEKEV